MGGHAQPQIHLQLLQRLLDGATPAEAIAAPRFVVSGGVVEAEAPGRLSEDAGHAQLIRIDADGTFTAASDPRADGVAIVV
jgi:gamma-glutamyltranspeptidase / glutathione hydrolase